MKKSTVLIYTSLLALIGACTVDQIEIEENIDQNLTENIITLNDSICASGLSGALQYNAFVKNGITIGSGDTEGPIAMGGDLTINRSFTVATQNAGAFFHNGEDLAASLVVNGKIIYNTSEGININQGYVKIGDLSGSTVYDLDNNNVATNTRITPGEYNETPRLLLQRNQTAESIDASNIIDFETAFAELIETSLNLSQLSNNVILEDGNKITLATDTINVLNLTGEELNGLTNFTFNNKPSISEPLLINVDYDGELVWKVQNQAGIGDQHGQFILYNFYNSSKITIESGTTIMGTVLAPSSEVIKKSSDNINGQVIADSYIHMNGELHHHPIIICENTEEEVCSLSIELIEEVGVDGTNLSINSEYENLSYEWSTGETTASVFVAPTETTTYTVTAFDEYDCETSVSITIEVIEEECDLTIELKQAYDDNGLKLYVECKYDNLTYIWSTNETTSSVYVSPTETTTYTVTVTDENGCETSTSITIEVPEEETEECTLAAELIEEYEGFGSNLIVESDFENLTYEWSTGETTALIYVEPTDVTTYTVIVTDENGCEVTESIEVYPYVFD